MGRATPPARSTSRTAPSRPASPRASRATLAPRAAKARAVARPIPPLDPVTTTTCLVCLSCSLIFTSGCLGYLTATALPGGLVTLAWEDFLRLGHEALLEHPPPVRVPLQQGHGRVLGLLERGVRRDRRDVGIGPHVEHRGTVSGQGAIPGGGDLVRLVHRDTVQVQAPGEARVG